MAVLQYTDCVPPLDAVDEAPGCALLRWTTEDGGKIEREVDGSVKRMIVQCRGNGLE